MLGRWIGFILNVLRSMRVAVVVLVVLATVAALGTLVPTSRSAEFYSETYGPVMGRLLGVTGFDDVYHSWWFVCLLAWLLISMTVCSLSRLARLIRTAGPSSVSLDEVDSDALRDSITCPISAMASVQSAEVHVREWLSQHRYRVSGSAPEPDRVELIAEKGRLGRVGGLVIHAGAVIVLLGGALSGVFSVSSKVQVEQNKTLQVEGTPMAIRLTNFAVDYYPDTDRVQEYRSEVIVSTPDGKETAGVISVNHPLVVSGYRIYQMNYRVNVPEVIVRALRAADGEAVGDYRIRIGESTHIEELGLRIGATSFQPDFVFHDGVGGTRSERLNNPAVHLEVSVGDGPKVGQWVFGDSEGAPHGADKERQHGFQLVSFETQYTSGFKIVRDHGRLVVYFGFVIAIVGSFIGCYIFHRVIALRIERHGADLRVSYAVGRTRNQLDLERELAGLSDLVRTRLGGTEEEGVQG